MLVLGLLAAPAVSADEETTLAPVDTLLASPLRSERDEGLRRLVAAGSAGLEAARGLVLAPDLVLRIGGWRALGVLGLDEDLDAALVALEVPDEAEADAAARAALAMAARLPIRHVAPLPERTLGRRGARALEAPVADLLRRSTPDEVPPALLRLGAGTVPVLVALADAKNRGHRPRDEAIDALAAVGGEHARQALDALLADEEVDLGRVLRALRNVARGPGLERAARVAFDAAARGGGRRGRVALRQEAALFLQACPPPVVDLELRRTLLVRALREGRGSRLGLAMDYLRAFLVLRAPDDAELGELVGLASGPNAERAWVLIALEPWKERAPVRKALEALAERGDLPPALDGWVRLLLGRSDAAQISALACVAVEAPITSEGPDARRLGLLLLGRLPGEPPPAVVRVGLEDSDPWCRSCALSLVERLPDAAPLEALARALAADRDPWVMEAAAELSCVPWDAALRARLAQALLAGPRELRARILALVTRRDGLVAPGLAESLAAASLDVRLRIAARLTAGPPGR
jgi:hypothetical protein